MVVYEAIAQMEMGELPLHSNILFGVTLNPKLPKL